MLLCGLMSVCSEYALHAVNAVSVWWDVPFEAVAPLLLSPCHIGSTKLHITPHLSQQKETGHGTPYVSR